MSIKKSDLTTADRMNMENVGMTEDEIAAFCGRVYDENHLDEIRLTEFITAQQCHCVLSFFVHDENTNTRSRRTGVVDDVTDSGIAIRPYKDQETAHALYDEFWSDFTTTGEINAAMYDTYLWNLYFQCEIDVVGEYYSFSKIVNPRSNFLKLTLEQFCEVEGERI
ncbi:MAG: hypothetical protein GY880_24250 [Planctomycetaceae bacterium]|nr:hypothetical protein [Planctomycetaceae bacterium]